MTTPLAARFKAMIAENGPMPVSTFMALCLMDADHGYYTQAMPFGHEGDFITAPEISQMFGELIATWLVLAHQKAAIKGPFTLLEMGPGRGTLMADILRTLTQIAPDRLNHADIHLLEASPKLQAMQAEKLAPYGKPITFLSTIETLPAQPALIIGNEFLDALPIRQFMRHQNRWHERLVGLDGDDFIFGKAPLPITHDAGLPKNATEGAIAEICAPALAITSTMAKHIKAHGGAALLIDYGHTQSACGDTLQAVAKHQYAPIFARPGEADLTAHVDFEALSKAARLASCHTATLTQGAFLLGLGLLERAGHLGAGKSQPEQENIRLAVERLAGPEQMGDLFKAMAIFPAREAATPPFEIA